MRVLPVLFLALTVLPAFAQPDRAAMTFDETEHRWTHRLLYVFAPSDEHPDFLAQRQMATGHDAGFQERDLLFITLLERGESAVDGQAMDAASAERLRERHDVEPGAFAVILVGKDGTEKRRAGQPVPVEEVFAQIDGMPMRQREMRERN